MTNQTLNETVINFDNIESLLTQEVRKTELFRLIVNAPFEYKVATAFLFLGIIVLLVANEETGNIDRVALSSTEFATNTTNVSSVPFSEIKIPLSHSENIIATAIRTQQPQDTTDWKFLFEPALTSEQARLNQASGGIAYSAVYPLGTTHMKGAIIFSYFQYLDNIGSEQQQFMKTYADLVNQRLDQTIS